jgi:hypothetical protein
MGCSPAEPISPSGSYFEDKKILFNKKIFSEIRKAT